MGVFYRPISRDKGGNARKRTRRRVGVYAGVSGSHSKHPCLQVSSGFRATVLKCAFDASLVSLPEMYNNNNNVTALRACHT